MATDEELMAGSQAGDRAALDELVLRYHQRIHRYLYRSTGEQHLAEDLTQECFVRLVVSGRLYQHPRPFRPWLYAIATNCMRRHFESAYQRHTTWLEDDRDEAIAGEMDMPHLLVGRWSDRQDLDAVMADLTPDHRAVIALRYMEDFALAEIAAILNLPVNTVKTRLLRALRRMRTLLEARHPAPLDRSCGGEEPCHAC